MSALAVYLEEQGIATVVVGLVRLHLEKIRPPRALWVPFELGRPLGPPNDPPFQSLVLRAALGLLDSAKAPVVLQDFELEDPGATGDTEWHPPDILSATGLAQEVEQLRQLNRAASLTFGRSTVGISGLEIGQAADFVARFESESPLPEPPNGVSINATLRFAIDDLKAYYLEAASAATGRPSSRQLTDWFWNETIAAATIRNVRSTCRSSDDRKRKLVGDSLVPRGQLLESES